MIFNAREARRKQNLRRAEIKTGAALDWGICPHPLALTRLDRRVH